MSMRAAPLATAFALFILAALLIFAARPSHMLDDEGRYRAFGVSDLRRSSVFAAPVIVVVVATASLFAPLVYELSTHPNVA